MASRFRSFRHFYRLLPQLAHSGSLLHQRQGLYSLCGRDILARMDGSVTERRCLVRWCSTMSEAEHESPFQGDFWAFFESALKEPEGPHHHWLNHVGKTLVDIDGIILVVANIFLAKTDRCALENTYVLERVKLLQQRYPKLNIFGLQSGISAFCSNSEDRIIQTIMKEFIMFPVLLSYKDLNEITKGASYLIFENDKSSVLFHKKCKDLHIMIKAIDELHLAKNGNDPQVQNSNSSWLRQPEVIMEPHACSSFRNLLLYFPSSIAADEDERRLFISDTNHHRIIITDGDGEILDCIGSLPGFEDGEFNSAKLLRPAASIYDGVDKCLYFVDAENHAIRKANMENRMVETVYPIPDSHKERMSMWSWMLNKLGMARVTSSDAKEFDMSSAISPWHLFKLEESDLLVINQSFETLWIISTAGEIKEVAEGSLQIMKICEEMMREKLALLDESFYGWLQENMDPCASSSWFSRVELMSSFVNFQNCIIFCDRVGQRILKWHRETKDVSSLQLSNFEMLGVPYWLDFPLESIFKRANACRRPKNNYCRHYNVLPGRCDIRVKVDIPDGTVLASQLQEGSIWRQARGSAVEILGSKAIATSSEKVGIAQQWFDELDNLAFSKSGESISELEEAAVPCGNSLEDKGTYIDCAVNLSPGTSEVIIYAVFYLKLSEKSCEHQLMTNADMVLDISKQVGSRRPEDDACSRLLLETCKDLREMIFMKPLHLKIKLDCGDYPSTPNSSKEVVSTDSTLHLNVSLM